VPGGAPGSRPARHPAELGQVLGLRPGGPVTLAVDDGEQRVRPLDAAIRRAQELVAEYVPGGVLLADELIRERA
jgi:hypothetical protein